MFVDKGLIDFDDERWQPTGDLETAAVPPTIQALLAARLDDLSREERVVLEPASVIGLAFAAARDRGARSGHRAPRPWRGT